MGIVACRIEGFDEGGMRILYRFVGLSLLKLEIAQAQLHFELRLNEVLPGFTLLNMERLDL